MKPNDQPAFPRPFSVDDVDPDISYPAHVGLSMRDYFAAKALQGLVSAWGGHDVTDFDELASDAYNMADAMLKAREQ